MVGLGAVGELPIGDIKPTESSGITGNLSLSQDDNSIISSAINEILSSLIVNQSDNSILGTSTVEINGQSSLTQSNNTIIGISENKISGSLLSTQSNNTLNSSSNVKIESNTNITQSNNVVSSYSTIGVNSSVNIGQSSNTIVSSTQSINSGNLNVTQDSNTIHGNSSIGIISNVNLSQSNNTIFASSGSINIGNVIVTQGDNIAQIQSNVGIVSNTTLVQSSNTIFASSGSINTGVVNIVQDSNTIQSQSNIGINGSVLKSQDDNNISSNAGSQIIISGSMIATQGNNTLSSTIKTSIVGLIAGAQSNNIVSNASIGIISNVIITQDDNVSNYGFTISDIICTQSGNTCHSIAKIWQNSTAPKNVELRQLNFLAPTGFRLEIDRIPGVTFFTQECSIPVIDMYFAEINTPMLDYPVPGNKLRYDSFTISFLIDENMKNYSEIINWMYGINNPESLDNNREYSFMEQYRLMKQGKSLFQTLFSDGILHILTNNNNENISIQFIDMFPTGLSNIKFKTDVDDIKYLTCDVTFKFSHFKKIINNQ